MDERKEFDSWRWEGKFDDGDYDKVNGSVTIFVPAWICPVNCLPPAPLKICAIVWNMYEDVEWQRTRRGASLITDPPLISFTAMSKTQKNMGHVTCDAWQVGL